jgi:membrane fusion protein, multidrug efflux system
VKKLVLSKRMGIMLISLAILFGIIILIKVIAALMIKHALASRSQLKPVSVMKAEYSLWQSQLKATGSLRAIRGVNVTTELAGMIREIYFTPGTMVKKGVTLVQLNADMEIGQLASLVANKELARITFQRDRAQFAAQAVSKQTVDSDWQNFRSLVGQVAEQAATVAKKTIRAPFSGRLGVSNVNPGQFLNAGDTVVSLQALDPIWADFYIPQQMLTQVKMGKPVTIFSDTHPGKKFKGKVTTINPAIDVPTRNVLVEATLPNHRYELTPGAFVYVEITTGKPKKYLTLPQTAVTFNTYGSIVYVVQQKGKDEKGKPLLYAYQSFVVTGDTRGDQIAILKGIKKGDLIVTSGQLKLKNGTQVFINNSVVLPNNPAPDLPNNH